MKRITDQELLLLRHSVCCDARLLVEGAIDDFAMKLLVLALDELIELRARLSTACESTSSTAAYMKPEQIDVDRCNQTACNG